MKKRIRIEGMSCEHCLKRVQNALSGQEGVSEVQVNLKEGTATFRVKETVTDTTLKELIEDSGYDVVSIENMD